MAGRLKYFLERLDKWLTELVYGIIKGVEK